MNRWIALGVLVAGCGSVDAPTPLEPLTYYEDIEPLMFQHCVTCHQPDGIGPGDWTDPDVVEQWAGVIADELAAGRMPPATADPECRDYEGSERLSLPDASRDHIIRWAEEGAVMGDKNNRDQGLEIPITFLASTDTTLPMLERHTLDLDSEGNEYYCFVLDNPFDEPRYITGFDVEVENRSVVHHMLLAIDYGGDAGIEYGTDGEQSSFRCQDRVIESDWGVLHAWTPGMEAVTFPDGYGMLVEPGQQLVLQMHYFGDPNTAPEDLSSYKMATTDAVDTEVYMIPFGPTGFRISAGDNKYSSSDYMDNPLPNDLELLGAFPHMHLLGKKFKAWVEHSDGGETCAMQGTYDFQNQLTYMLKDPIVLGQGDKAWMKCTWDNSADNPRQFYDPPQDITYGEGSNEEMCFLLTYVAVK